MLLLITSFAAAGECTYKSRSHLKAMPCISSCEAPARLPWGVWHGAIVVCSSLCPNRSMCLGVGLTRKFTALTQ